MWINLASQIKMRGYRTPNTPNRHGHKLMVYLTYRSLILFLPCHTKAMCNIFRSNTHRKKTVLSLYHWLNLRSNVTGYGNLPVALISTENKPDNYVKKSVIICFSKTKIYFWVDWSFPSHWVCGHRFQSRTNTWFVSDKSTKKLEMGKTQYTWYTATVHL